ncbi:MAG: thioredoxin family protein [Verrucomicrobia bacterium]|nr:thioredoxin family protein [Verrucomicrobiota bacterium]MBV8376978.1 thioredoxin family protein [Verrucomicrobiota bacterium]
MIKTLLFTCGLLVAAAGLSFAEPEVGKPAPNFSLPDTQGKNHTLADLKGKYVVLEWYQPDCPFVGKHYRSGNMQGLQREYTAKGVTWLSIDSSAPGEQGNYPAAKLDEIAKQDGAARTALLLDPSGEVGRLYGAKTTPDMYVIDPKGILVYEGAIDNKRSTNPADVKTATNYVREALEAAMAGKPAPTPATRPYGCSVKYVSK